MSPNLALADDHTLSKDYYRNHLEDVIVAHRA
jgi:hypothetical protein